MKSPTIKEIKKDLLFAAKLRIDSAKRMIKDAGAVRAATKGKRKWVPVDKIQLKIGKPYVTRRQWGDGRFEKPCVAYWTDYGWLEICNYLYRTHASKAFIEVLV